MSLLEAIGTCEKEIPESLMNAVTGLSGSGPAYMFIILDALADGGVKMGMSRSLALRLAAQSMLGSGAMVVNELNTSELEGNTSGGKHVMLMKEEICSPGGTTIYGIDELENHRVRHAFISCVEAATLRARELEDQDKD
jgi:pyrroline-5-carboxylate reductase